MKLMTASSLVALRKDAQDGVRPIAVPAIWRKVASSMIVEQYKDVVTTYLGKRQFGIYVANGSAAFATRVQELAEASPQSLIIQCDMANAFGSVHRHALQQAMQRCSSDLSHMTRSWLAHESTGYMLRADGRRHKVVSSRGIQQGDPLSALAFGILMEIAFRSLEERLEAKGIPFDKEAMASVYIDDAILQFTGDAAEAAFQEWQEVLCSLGLTLQVEKTIIYQPSLVSPPPGRLADIWRNQPRQDAIVLCGLLVWADWVEQGSNAIPCGSQKFIDDFLQSQHHSITRRFEPLTAVAKSLGADDGGQHIALHIARSSILAMQVHLLRGPPSSTNSTLGRKT
eukprot:4739245-Amphidinium_carterae.4